MSNPLWSESTRAAMDALHGQSILNAPGSRLSTYRVAGPAALLAKCSSLRDLESISRAIGATGVSVCVLGRGSKILLSDRGFDGLMLCLGGPFRRIRPDAEGVVAGGGADLPAIVVRCLSARLTGLEWMEGIPGTLGGAVRMNAGCYDYEMRSVLVEAEVLNLRTGQLRQCGPSELDLGHRSSAIEGHEVVTRARLTVGHGDLEQSRELVRKLRMRRDDEQPGRHLRTGGSVFKNPGAWHLVREAGAHDVAIGCARVSPKHANFIEVDRSASRGGNDVYEVMCTVRELVLSRLGVALEPETVLVGFTDSERARLGL